MKRFLAIAFVVLFATAAVAQVTKGGLSLFLAFGGGPTPVGVTLQAIDGESMISPTTMSHTYYTRNGFSVAASTAYNGKSWDDPSFIPIGSFDSTMDGSNQTCPSGTCTTQGIWTDLGWNTMWAVGVYTPAAGRSAGLWLVGGGPVGQCDGGAVLASGSGTEVAGWYTYDEPPTYANATSCISISSNALTNTRFFQTTGTIHWVISGAPSGTPGAGTMTDFLFTGVATPNASLRHFGMFGNDVYFFAYDDFTQDNVSVLYNVSGQNDFSVLATNAQMRRGSNYGDYVDTLRNGACGNGGTGGLIPISVIIETGGPFNDPQSTPYIQPPELDWAVWQSLIHGARGIDFFDHSFGGPAGMVDDDMYDSYFQSASNYAAGISMYAQVKKTVARVNEHAAKILSPTALGYATVSPASTEITPLPPCLLTSTTASSGTNVLTFSSVPSWVANGQKLSVQGGGIPSNATISGSTGTTISLSQNLTKDLASGAVINIQGTNAWNTGFDIVSKYVSGAFYIFASARAAETATNISATFTVNDPGATSVTVLDESRSINIVGGHFTDNFATAYTVHIYQVNH